MLCPHCQQENPPEARFCLHCGTRLALVCPHCQQSLPPTARFCMACGQALVAPAAPVGLDVDTSGLASPGSGRLCCTNCHGSRLPHRIYRAQDVARHQRATSWELRTATSLTRLWQQQGKRTEAQDLLAEVYNWFTEGFDSADLQEARALIKALA